MTDNGDPVIVAGGGPVGLMMALGLTAYGLPVVVLEEDQELSLDTKAGTILTRTLEVLNRYRALDGVLARAVRLDEIGDLDRSTGRSRGGVMTGALADDTRFPFIINLPQHYLEPALAQELEAKAQGALRLGHRLVSFEQADDHVAARVDGPSGRETIRGSYLIGCDGGRSTIRSQLGVAVSGHTLSDRYLLIDLLCDLDITNPRDYPYLAYFGDPQEWMILVRLPHCWRFLFPLPEGAPEPSEDELLEKARTYIGDVSDVSVLGRNLYAVHHRVAETWRTGRVFLAGDAAHLITPMWALGLNTGVLDASNLPWRLAWVQRGWATDHLLDGYEAEQSPIAILGAAEMAESARLLMSDRYTDGSIGGQGQRGVALTRTLLGVRLDVDGTGDWSMVRSEEQPAQIGAGDRVPDLPLFGDEGRIYVHDLCRDQFVALYFCDARRRRTLPPDQPGLRHLIVSRWDAPHDSGMRSRAMFDPGERLRAQMGITAEAVILIRPDAHVAAFIHGVTSDDPVTDIYDRITGILTTASMAN